MIEFYDTKFLKVNGYEHLTNTQEITDAMQRAASPGQDVLDTPTYNVLQDLTQRLTDVHGIEAMDEYDRYIDTANRGLELDNDKLYDTLSDKVILVTGGTGLIGSTLMKELTNFSPKRLVSISRGETETYRHVAEADYFNVDLRDMEGLSAVIDDVKPDINLSCCCR